MAYKIVRTKKFLKNLLDVLVYIEKEWGLKSSINFQTILDKKIAELTLHPKMGSTTFKNKNIRKLTITKLNKIYYRIKGTTITILILFETKQNPYKNTYE